MRLLAVAAVLAVGCARNVPTRMVDCSGPPEPRFSASESSPEILRLVEPPREARGRRVTLAFRDAHIRDVLDAIARVSGGNIIVAGNVEGKLSLNLYDVPWTEAVDAVVKSVPKTMAVWERPDLVRIVDP